MLSRGVYQVLANGYSDITFTFGRFTETILLQCQVTDPDTGGRVHVHISGDT
jgi:hypothetical protein